MTEAGEILLNLPDWRYTATVRWRGEILDERTLAAGEFWKLDAR